MFEFNPEELFVPQLPAPRENHPDPDSAQPLDADEIADLLGEHGPFAAGIPEYEHRAGQLKMIRSVVQAFNSASHLMVEAGTGTGKSMAYLVPAIRWAILNNMPVVVSTNTKNLQSQLFEKDLPLIHKILGDSIKTALIKGRSNYLCLRKLMYMLEHADYEIRPADRGIAQTIIDWVKSTQTGDFTELDSAKRANARRLALDLVSTSDECAGRKCRHFRQCFLRRARAKSMAADIVIANHSLVFSEMNEKGPAIPPYSHLILDEAHNIEDAATRHFSIEISTMRFYFPLRRLGHSGTKGKGLLASLLRQVESGAITGNADLQKKLRKQCRDIGTAIRQIEKKREPFFDAMAAMLQKRGDSVRRLTTDDKLLDLWTVVTHTAAELTSAIAALNGTIKSLNETMREIDTESLGFHNEYIRDLDAQRNLMQEISDDIAFVLNMESSEYVYWIERCGPTGDSARAWAAPISIGEQMYDELYTKISSIIFVSATLSAGGSFNFIKRRLGIDRIPEERLLTLDAGSPFDHDGQSRMMVPMFLPEPGGGDDTEYTRMLGQFLASLFRRINGRGLVLFTSYTMLRETTSIVRELLNGTGIEVLAQGENSSREMLIKQFRDDISSVLMGTHSFWEGVDIVGESLSCVVLARLPFPMFTEPIVAARCEQIEASGGNAFMNYTIPTAVIKFRQGFGRLIRHRNDRGIVITADRRIVSKRYGHWFRRGIPATTSKHYDLEEMLNTIDNFLNL